MSWGVKRETTREEDAAYCLLGIFDIHMPLIYGEGRKKALARLHKEIKESLKDKSPLLRPAHFSKHEDAFKRQDMSLSSFEPLPEEGKPLEKIILPEEWEPLEEIILSEKGEAAQEDR
jgi:hypothetical protein